MRLELALAGSLAGVRGKKVASSASIAIRDAKASNATGQTDVSLTTMGLNFAAGNLLIIIAASHLNTASAAITHGPATGWTQITTFNLPASSSNQHDIIALWKIADGTENTVDVFNWNAGTPRYSYHAMSYDIVGSPSLGTGATSEIIATAPTQQSILAAVATGPVLAVAMAYSGSAGTAPSVTFSQTPDQTLTGDDGGAGVRGRTSVVTKLFASGAVDMTADMTDVGNDNGLLSFFLRLT